MNYNMQLHNYNRQPTVNIPVPPIFNQPIYQIPNSNLNFNITGYNMPQNQINRNSINQFGMNGNNMLNKMPNQNYGFNNNNF
jgi:hypothetical protein